MSVVKSVKTRHVLREFILRSPEMSALVGERVFSSHLSDADGGTLLKSGPLVIFNFDGGDLRWHGAVQIQFMHVYAYSKNSLIEAARVYDALCELIQHERIAVEGIDATLVTRENERPIDGYNKHVEGWFVRGRWIIEGV